MASFNQVILIGNLTRDPQLKYSPNQTAICEFGLAVNHKWKSAAGEAKEEVTFVDCTAWGRIAEVINQYVQKGNPLMVVGRLKLDSWEDKSGGGKRSKLSVVVESMQLLGSPRGGEGERTESRPPSRRPVGASQQDTPAPFDDSKQFSDDDIPF